MERINTDKFKIAIKEIFASNDHQNEVITDIYQMILPQWNDIKKLNGHLACGEKLWCYICELFIKFDKEHHPQVMAGGAWINFGFSSDKCLAAWEINLSGCSIIYKETKDVECSHKETII